MDPGRVRPTLENIISIRAIPNLSARDAVGFVFLLKRILQKELADERPNSRELDSRIDELALTAFDLCADCRSQIYSVHVDEAKWRVAPLEENYSEFGRR